MKTVKEVAVKLENRPGKLSEIGELLAANGIMILALTVTTEGDVGTVNLVVTDPTRVVNILESAGYAPALKDILAVEAPHHPGGLNALLKTLRLAGVNVAHLYSCFGETGAGDARVILVGVDNLETAHAALAREWFRLYGEELYNI
jgi:hypothetical protein